MPNKREIDLREMGVAIERESSQDYYYSESLGKYVALDFLKVDSRVVQAASDLKINLCWDEEGRVCNISFADAKRLLTSLGSTMLTPREFWYVYEEARQKGDSRLQESLQTANGTEWLDIVYLKKTNGNEVEQIEHPVVSAEGVIFINPQTVEQPQGRPGWFDPTNNIDINSGTPVTVSTQREKGTAAWAESTWKYWSTFKIGEVVSGIRGYVTSSGTPSLDLDIPIEAKQPVLMIRECRDKLLAPDLSIDILDEYTALETSYLQTLALIPAVRNQQDQDTFYTKRQELINFITKHHEEYSSSSEKAAQHISESALDMLGTVHLEAITRHDSETLTKIQYLREFIFRKPQEAGNIENFSNFLLSSRDRLTQSVAENKRIVFVMGHKNPDTDTAISAIFESYVKQLQDPDAVFIPILQASHLPDEIARLLGKELSSGYICSTETIYQEAEKLGQARWILVDHNISDKQRFAIGLVDHHILSDTARKQQIPKTWEMMGSCSAQVATKMFGLGIVPDRHLARLLHGATLMDTENRGLKKMTTRDELIMDYLRNLSEIENENEFFQNLMGHLLNTDDANRLFERDYKEDWGIFGFAVAKVKNVFAKDGRVLKQQILDGLVAEAQENNLSKHFCMTLVKVVDYLEDNETVNRERIYLIFNDFASTEFQEAMFAAVIEIIRFEFGQSVQIETTDNSIDYWGVGDQLSRKVTAPKFEELVAAFNEYFYSKETNLFIKREFLQDSPEVRYAAAKLGITLYVDSHNRICNITFNEAKRLVDALGYKMMSLPEYWEVLREAEKLHDVQMEGHLRSRGFVEFLDTVILDKNSVINHPQISNGGSHTVYKGNRKNTNIPTAVPALIYPNEVDIEAGFPTKTYISQDKYADPQTWRYWSPDINIAIPTRGYIFLLDKPALDCKIHPDDALPNLGIRVAAKKVKYPKVEFIKHQDDLEIKISKH